jgi:hypothetical protein
MRLKKLEKIEKEERKRKRRRHGGGEVVTEKEKWLPNELEEKRLFKQHQMEAAVRREA